MKYLITDMFRLRVPWGAPLNLLGRITWKGIYRRPDYIGQELSSGIRFGCYDVKQRDPNTWALRTWKVIREHPVREFRRII